MDHHRVQHRAGHSRKRDHHRRGRQPIHQHYRRHRLRRHRPGGIRQCHHLDPTRHHPGQHRGVDRHRQRRGDRYRQQQQCCHRHRRLRHRLRIGFRLGYRPRQPAGILWKRAKNSDRYHWQPGRVYLCHQLARQRLDIRKPDLDRYPAHRPGLRGLHPGLHVHFPAPRPFLPRRPSPPAEPIPADRSSGSWATCPTQCRCTESSPPSSKISLPTRGFPRCGASTPCR